MNSLIGVDIAIGAHRVAGDDGDEDDIDLDQINSPEDDEFLDAVNELVGGGVPHPEFDNTNSYSKGDVVTHWGQYWQATRDVKPPMFPSVMSGDVPGDSDAWRSMSAQEVVNEVMGVDLSQVTPYLSAFASGFGPKQDAAKSAEQAKKDADLKAKEAESERKAKSAREIVWTVLAVLGAGVLGSSIYFAARRK